MKKIILVALLGLSVANAGKNLVPAISEPISVPKPDKPLGLYIGAGLTYSNSECSCQDIGLKSPVTFKSNYWGFNLKGGYDFNKYIGFEAKYVYIPEKDEKRGIQHYGLYAKPYIPITEKLDIFGLIGYGSTSCTGFEDNIDDFSWGIGAEYRFNNENKTIKDGFGIYFEYLQPINKTEPKEVKVNILNFGISYHF